MYKRENYEGNGNDDTLWNQGLSRVTRTSAGAE